MSASRRRRRREPRDRTDRRYRKLRLRVLREEPLCRLCGWRASREVDHIVRLADGGALYDRKNLQGLCRRCHRNKTAVENMNLSPDRAEWRAFVDALKR